MIIIMVLTISVHLLRTGIQNNFITKENNYVTPDLKIQNIEVASHDVTPKRKEDLRNLVLRELQQKKTHKFSYQNSSR